VVVVEEEVVSPPAAPPVSVPVAASVPVPVAVVERSVVEVVLLDVLVLVSVSGTTTVVEGAGSAGCWFTMVVEEPGTTVVSLGRIAKK
jgi:hypothetical protein